MDKTKLKSQFLVKDNQFIFNGVYMEVYIPTFYFENNIAQMLGNKVETLGIFDYKVFDSVDGKSKTKERNTYHLPTSIVLQPSNIEKGNKIEKFISTDIEDENYEDDDSDVSVYILKFYKGDIFITNLTVEKTVKSVESFIKLLSSGKMPYNVHYDEVIKALLDNIDINSFNIKAPALDLELITSELYRDKRNLSKAYRFIAGKKGKADPKEYVMINLKKIATNNSTFTALTGENMKQSLISSINKTNEGIKENESPVEKTIKY